MEIDFDNRRLSIQPDFDFHVGIAAATGNEIFVQLLENLHIGLKKTMAVAQNLSRESVVTGPGSGPFDYAQSYRKDKAETYEY